MEGEGASSEKVKSPEEIEEGIISTQKVTWDPFTVLPKEIYVKIFDKLDNPIDKQNFMNAHRKWYELFKDKRTLFLFEYVFKEVCKIDGKLGGSIQDWYDLRLVCRDWDNAIQNCLQLSASNFTLSNVGHRIGGERGFRIYNPAIFLFNAEKLENDLKNFSVTHPSSRNPFLSRSLFLFPSQWDWDEQEIRRYDAAVDALLMKYGHHVWYFDMSMPLKPHCCRQIAKWLSLMPELKTLRLENPKRLNQVELEEIRDMELVQPELRKLVVLKSERLPSAVFNKLFGNLRELEKIQIRVSWKGSFFRDYEMPPSRESLKEASFTFKMKELPDFLEYLVRSEPFPNLKKLGIDDKMAPCDNTCLPWPEWKTTFKLLEEKLPALEEFSFRLPKAVLDVDKETAKSQSLSATLNLPKLKKLWITLPNLTSIDFLLPCKALEELNVFLEFYQFNVESAGLGRREKIKLNVDLSTLWESNVWDVFPKLRVLDVEALNSFNYLANRHRYEKIGQKRKYTINSCSGRSS